MERTNIDLVPEDACYGSVPLSLLGNIVMRIKDKNSNLIDEVRVLDVSFWV